MPPKAGRRITINTQIACKGPQWLTISSVNSIYLIKTTVSVNWSENINWKLAVRTVSCQTIFWQFNLKVNQFPALMLTNIDFTHTECGPQPCYSLCLLMWKFYLEILCVLILREYMAHSDCGVYRLHYGGFCPFEIFLKSTNLLAQNCTTECLRKISF